MYVISSRKGFWDNNCVLPQGEDDKIAEIGPEEVGHKKEWESREPADYESEINGRKVLLLCHGYNSGPRAVVHTYYEIQDMEAALVKYFDVVVGYTWPGSIGAASYPWAWKRVPTVATRFAKLLETTISACSELGVMSHSLGCKISLIAHKQLHQRKVKKADRHWQFLMAASVNDNYIERGKRYFNATLYCDKTYMLHSKRDATLRDWFPEVEERSGGEKGPALGYSGPANIAAISRQTTIIDCTSVVGGHGRYKKTQQVYEYIHRELHNKPHNDYPAVTLYRFQ